MELSRNVLTSAFWICGITDEIDEDVGEEFPAFCQDQYFHIRLQGSIVWNQFQSASTWNIWIQEKKHKRVKKMTESALSFSSIFFLDISIQEDVELFVCIHVMFWILLFKFSHIKKWTESKSSVWLILFWLFFQRFWVFNDPLWDLEKQADGSLRSS